MDQRAVTPLRIYLAGATGAVGRRLLPMLLGRGHHVVATTRTVEKLPALALTGAEPVLVDGLDRDAVMRSVVSTKPEAIIHEMTSLAGMRSLRRFDEQFAITNRLRTEGTSHLLAAAREAGTKTFVAQSFAGWPYAPRGGALKSEDDPLDDDPAKSMRKVLKAIRALEEMVIGASGICGIVLRYGPLYGPGTGLADDGPLVRLVRHREFPIFGAGDGVWSFIHIDDAAMATQLAVEKGAPGIFNIVDDEPACVAEWLPELARAVGAKPPFRLPAWIGRLTLGSAGMSLMTKARGCSNLKAKRILGWAPRYRSWREGFRTGLSAAPVPGSEYAGQASGR